MADPKVADTRPQVIQLEAGTHWWCACGQSENQPFCDGSHRGTEFQPLQFDVKAAGRRALCMCKHTATAPDCDGSHSEL